MNFLALWLCVSLTTVSFALEATVRSWRAASSVCESDTGLVGYVDFEEKDKHVFFYIAESRNDPTTDPIILWMSGGPGASSVGFGLFFETGPCRITSSHSTEMNPSAWNNNVTVLYIDQPGNVGFSHSGTLENNLDESTELLYDVLEAILKSNPGLADLDFYIVGESYAGASVPALATKIHKTQKSSMGLLVQNTSSRKRQFISLKGIALGNSQVSQELQWRGWYETGCVGNRPLFNSTVCEIIQETEPSCEKLMGLCGSFHSHNELCEAALGFCRSTSVAFLVEKGLNPYDFRRRCEEGTEGCYEQIDWLTRYLNSIEVKRGLKIDEGTDFRPLDLALYERFQSAGEMYRPSLSHVSELLSNGYKVLVYVGNQDWYCNAAGMTHLVDNIPWRNQGRFRTQAYSEYRRNGEQIGFMKVVEGLSFAEISNAGHMSPYDKPEEVLFMLNFWLKDGLRSTGAQL